MSPSEGSRGRPAGAPELERIAGRDGVWLQDSPTNLMVINSVITLDRIDLETLRELWQKRVMTAGGGRRYARFKKRVVTQGRQAYWQEDPEFSLERHIFVPEGAEKLDSKETLQRHLGDLASQPLPRDRPRWQIQLIPEFGQEDGSAAIVRIHHCMGDGIGLVPVMFSLMDTSPDGDSMLLPAVIDRAGKPPNKLALGLKTAFIGPILLLGKMLWRRDRNPLHGPPLSGDKQVAWTVPLDLDRVKAAKNELGATVNDVLVACVAGGLRRYARERGADLQQLRASMPINIRSRFESLEMDNKFAAVLLPLSVGIDDAHQRVAATSRQMQRLKRSIEPYFTYVIVNIMQKLLPATVSRSLIDFLANKCSCVLTNVPGPQTEVYIAGRRLRTWLFWVPQRADIGVGISILTLSGALRIGVIADTSLVDDPQVLIEAFETELRELIG